MVKLSLEVAAVGVRNEGVVFCTWPHGAIHQLVDVWLQRSCARGKASPDGSVPLEPHDVNEFVPSIYPSVYNQALSRACCITSIRSLEEGYPVVSFRHI